MLGVLPYDPAVQLDEEDSLGLAPDEATTGEIDVAVPRLPGLSNFTDLAALARAPGVAVRYVTEAGQLHRPDLVVLPGTRTTVQALTWLRAVGLAAGLDDLVRDPAGPIVLGLCGGFQILGRTIDDPHAVESAAGRVEALGWLDVDTCFEPRKTLCRVTAAVTAPGSPGHGCPVVGYEVHQGVSRRRAGAVPWLRLRREPGGETVDDGAVGAGGRMCGTYVHGLFDDARFCRALVAALRQRRGLPPLAEGDWLSQRRFRAGRYVGLAGWLEQHCDLRPVARRLGIAT